MVQLVGSRRKADEGKEQSEDANLNCLRPQVIELANKVDKLLKRGQQIGLPKLANIENPYYYEASWNPGELPASNLEPGVEVAVCLLRLARTLVTIEEQAAEVVERDKTNGFSATDAEKVIESVRGLLKEVEKLAPGMKGLPAWPLESDARKKRKHEAERRTIPLVRKEDLSLGYDVEPSEDD